MVYPIKKRNTPRYGIPYNKVPTVTGNVSRYYQDDYGYVLDAVYEMVDQVSNGNGVSLENAMLTVQRDYSLYILPSHQTMICTLLRED